MAKRTLTLVLDFKDDDPNVDVTMEQVYENVLENVGDLLETKLPDEAARVYFGDPLWLLDGNNFKRQI